MDVERDVQRVLDLETIRQRNGYKAGWLYYRCKDQGLLEAYEHLKMQQKIGGSESITTEHQVARSTTPLLRIELVPQTSWFSNVRSEVSADDWNKLKKMTFSNARYRCEICGGQGPQWPVECHERWQYDDAKAIQKLVGLMALCPACHEVKHIGFAGMNGRMDNALQHLAHVNQWSAEQAESYVHQQADIWRRRSRHAWTLNIQWLEQYSIVVQHKPIDR